MTTTTANENTAVTDDGRDRLRVMPEASQQAQFLLVTFLCCQRKVTQRTIYELVDVAKRHLNFVYAGNC